jgi:hypothetical protein
MAAIVVLAVSSSQADITINFDSPSGSIHDNGGSNIGANSLFLVYLSPDETADFNNVDPTSALNGETFLGALDGGSRSGRINGNSAANFSGSGYDGQHLYIAVFDYAYSSYSGSVPVGTYYGLGYVSSWTTTLQGGTSSPDIYGGSIASPGGIQTSSQLVPEPGTWALFGLGAVLVGAHIRRRKNW